MKWQRRKQTLDAQRKEADTSSLKEINSWLKNQTAEKVQECEECQVNNLWNVPRIYYILYQQSRALVSVDSKENTCSNVLRIG